MNRRTQHWEDVYARKAVDEVSWFQAEPALSLRLIGNTGIAPDAPVIDVGGGASRLADRLLDRGYSRLAVLDLSGHALAASRERLGRRAAQVAWYHGDVTAFEPPHEFALWHDRAVFHFLTDAGDRRRYREVLLRALPSGGHVVIATFAPGGPTRCSGLEIVQYDAEALHRALGGEFAVDEAVQELHRTPAGKEQAFQYVRLHRL